MYAESRMSGRDWKSIVKASGIGMTANEADAAAEMLDSLHKDFAPLVRDLTPDVEPALGFSAEDDAG